MIDFTCDGCGAALKIGDEWAGKLGHCPHCGTDTPVSPRRTSKLTIIARMGCFPLVATLSWAIVFGCLGGSWTFWPIMEGGLSAIFGIIFILWLIVNLGTFLYDPKNYLVWKRGGGDPFFDTLHWPFNTDDDSVRYAELYRERERMELGPPVAPPVPPDSTQAIDDPNFV